MVEHAPVVGIGAEEARAHAELLPRIAHLLDGELDGLHGQHGHPEEAIGIGLAVLGEPAVVGAAHRGGQLGLLDRPREEAHARIEEGGVDAVQVHVGDARVRIEAALAAVDVLHGLLGHLVIAGADGPDDPEAFLAPQHLLADLEPLLAVGVHDDARSALAVGGIDVLVPDVHRLQHMSVGVDHVVGACHGSLLFGGYRFSRRSSSGPE
jgi:hypothetical protein